jgi:hypothetical protein
MNGDNLSPINNSIIRKLVSMRTAFGIIILISALINTIIIAYLIFSMMPDLNFFIVYQLSGVLFYIVIYIIYTLVYYKLLMLRNWARLLLGVLFVVEAVSVSFYAVLFIIFFDTFITAHGKFFIPVFIANLTSSLVNFTYSSYMVYTLFRRATARLYSKVSDS